MIAPFFEAPKGKGSINNNVQSGWLAGCSSLRYTVCSKLVASLVDKAPPSHLTYVDGVRNDIRHLPCWADRDREERVSSCTKGASNFDQGMWKVMEFFFQSRERVVCVGWYFMFSPP